MISSMDSTAAAWPTSGSEPAPRPSVTCTPNWISRVALDMASAWASVLATMNSAPSRLLEIMLLTALPPPPPTPITEIFGLISAISGLGLVFMTGNSPRRSRHEASVDFTPRLKNRRIGAAQLCAKESEGGPPRKQELLSGQPPSTGTTAQAAVSGEDMRLSGDADAHDLAYRRGIHAGLAQHQRRVADGCRVRWFRAVHQAHRDGTDRSAEFEVRDFSKQHVRRTRHALSGRPFEKQLFGPQHDTCIVARVSGVYGDAAKRALGEAAPDA